MTEPPTPSSPPGPSPAPTPPDPLRVSPPGRVRPRRLIAVAIAAVLLAGIAGLVATALVGEDGSPSSDRLEQPLDLDGPAVATRLDASGPDTLAPAAAPPTPRGSIGDEPGGDEGVAPVASIVSPSDEAELPPLASAPVELPDVVAPPPVASVLAASPVDELTPDSVGALAGWDVVDRQGGYVAFSDGAVVVEVFAVAESSPAAAGTVLADFLDGRLADADQLAISDSAPQAAARSDFVSVAGAEYVAVTAGQQGTRTMSGAALAAVGSDSAVVATTSREGRASAAELAADAELLQSVLAHVDTT